MTDYDSRPDTYDHIMKVQGYLFNFVVDLLNRAEGHDVSKLSGTEKEAFDIATPKLADSAYGSDEYRATLKEIKPAITQHYEKNSHHPEHYPSGIDGMSLTDLIEMLCDWKAASQRHSPKVEAEEGERTGESSSMVRSLNHNAVRFNMSPQLVNILHNTITENNWE